MSLFYINKITAIAYIGILYFILGVTGSYIIETSQPRTKDENKMIIGLEILLNVSLLVVMAYFIRKIVKHIPYPFDNLVGFEYSKLKEYGGGVIIAWSVFSIQKTLSKRIQKILHLV